MDIYEALYTTRAMRRVKPDAIPQDVQARILDAAIRAPTGGNAQGWRFLLIDDADVIGKLGPVYRDCIDRLFATVYGEALEAANKDPDAPESVQLLKMHRSAGYMAEHFEGYPLMLTAFSKGGDGGSIFPGVWSAMLAARAEGIGSTITSVLAFEREKLFDILGVPEEGWQFHCLVPMGYPTGRWGWRLGGRYMRCLIETSGVVRWDLKFRSRCGRLLKHDDSVLVHLPGLTKTSRRLPPDVPGEMEAFGHVRCL